MGLVKMPPMKDVDADYLKGGVGWDGVGSEETELLKA